MPFLIANSGQPYNITTGLDPNDTGFPAARPALEAGVPGPRAWETIWSTRRNSAAST